MRASEKTRRLTGLALMTAIIVVLQVVASFVKFGPFTITLALAPILIGAALYGPKAGACLGGVFGAVVLLACILGWDPGGAILWNANPFLTALVCLGKGILAGGTIAIMIDWRIAVVVWGGFLILTALTRYVSLGSLWAGASFPFISWYCYPQPPIVVLAFCLGGLIVWKHRANIQRIREGKEYRFGKHNKK